MARLVVVHCALLPSLLSLVGAAPSSCNVGGTSCEGDELSLLQEKFSVGIRTSKEHLQTPPSDTGAASQNGPIHSEAVNSSVNFRADADRSVESRTTGTHKSLQAVSSNITPHVELKNSTKSEAEPKQGSMAVAVAIIVGGVITLATMPFGCVAAGPVGMFMQGLGGVVSIIVGIYYCTQGGWSM